MSKEFKLSGGDADFTSRQKSVFDQLSTLTSPPSSSVSIDDFQIQRDSSRRSHHRRGHETRHLRGQESLFKRPEPPNPRGRGQNRIPDHRKNPQKWTHYSLGDVSSDDMSDRTNTSTALSFLNELRERKEKEAENDDMETEQTSSTVQFKKPIRKRNEVVSFRPSSERSETHKPIFRGSKRVMPEYVVGQKSGKSAKKVKDVKEAKEKNSSNEMKLMHLMDDENGDDQ